jgi:hypothetical protein
MVKTYRQGAIGAMLDEYERALEEYIVLVTGVPEPAFAKIIDPDTEDEDCRSIQTITHHVIRAGFGYADYLRDAFGAPSSRPDLELSTHFDAEDRLRAMFAYTLETLDGKHLMPYEEISGTRMQVRWGPVYDIEQLIEHAIVHVLRHRRQVNRFLLREGL